MEKKRQTIKYSSEKRLAKSSSFLILAIIFTSLALAPSICAAYEGSSLIFHDSLESADSIEKNGGMLSDLIFIPGHLAKKHYHTKDGKLFYTRAKVADNAVFYDRESSLSYMVPEGWKKDKGSVELWIKPDWTPGSSLTDDHALFSAYDKDSDNNIILSYDSSHSAFVLEARTDDRIYRAMNNGNAKSMIINRWHHIAATWGERFGLRVYINGKEKAHYRTGASDSWDDIKIDVYPEEVVIGNIKDPYYDGNPADAGIDEIKIYNEEKANFTAG